MTGLKRVLSLAAVALAVACNDELLTDPNVAQSPGSAASSAPPTIMTNKTDYIPTEMVVMVGAGWQPGETVTLTLEENPKLHEDRTWDVTADTVGGFWFDEFRPEPHHVGVGFILTARGQSLGLEAQTTFTDAIVLGDTTVNHNGDPGASELSLQAPSPIAAGHLLVAQVTVEGLGTTQVICTPGGWTSIRRTNNSSSVAQQIFYRVADGTETPTTAWQWQLRNTSGDCGTTSNQVTGKGAVGGVIAYSGVNVTHANGPIFGSGGATGSSTTINAPTAVDDPSNGAGNDNIPINSRVVRYFGNDKEFQISTAGSGSSQVYFTRRAKSGGGFEKPSGAAADGNQAALGSASAVTGSNSGNGGNWVAQTVALREAAVDPAPTVTINQAAGQADPTNTSPITFTVVFSETVTGFATGDVTLSGTAGATTATVTGSGANYTVAVSGMTGPGTVIATIAAGVATDGGGNGNTASTSTDNTVTYDASAPTVTINQAAGQVDPTNTSPINFTVVFSEAVANFATGDVTLSGTAGATTAAVTGSGTTYNVAVSGMTTNGTVIASIDAAKATDGAGNPNAASTSTDNTVNYLATQPSVTINQAAGQADPTNTSPINFTVVFSEPVTGFATGDVTLSGTAGATTGTVTGSGTTYNVAVSGMTGDGTVIATIAAGVASDGAGNTNTASTSTDNTVTYDATEPTVTINQAAGQADPTNTSPINFTVIFSDAVTNFATGDVTLSGTAGATTGTVTGSGTTYNVAVSGMTTNGTVIASIGAGKATDGAGNPNAASTSTDNTVTYDATDPTVTINQAAGQADPTNTSPINFTVVFSEAVTGFATGDVTLSGTAGATTATVSGSGTTYNVAVSGMANDGTVIASIGANKASDAAGNGNAASTSTDNTVTYVATPPSVTINQASGQADPTNTSPISFTVVFSEPVTGFATGDVTLNGTAGATTGTVTGSGTTYNVAVSGMTGNGTVIATIATGVATDGAGNGNTASTSTDNTVTYDASDPTVTINQAAGQADPTNSSPINFTVVFSESVTGFATGDVTLSGTAGATTGAVTGSGTTYNVAVSGMTANGTVIATIAADVAQDAAGNGNAASTSTDNTVTYDTTPPDNEAPAIKNFVLTPTYVAVATSYKIAWQLDDTDFGGSDIAAAEYSLNGGATWLPVASPKDGSYDEPIEDIEVTLTSPSLPDVVNVCVRGRDAQNNQNPSPATSTDNPWQCAFLPVYDPSAGFVTGGGWIQSPSTACPVFCGGADGKANFGFVSKYQKGAQVPTGHTEFQFHAGNLTFSSTSYEWLVVQGATKASYKGLGTINGSGSYKFLLSVYDAGSSGDKFRIKIWTESGGVENVIYDNEIGASSDATATTLIGGGSIVIHAKK